MSITITASSWSSPDSINVSWAPYPNATGYTVFVFDYLSPPISEIVSASSGLTPLPPSITSYTLTNSNTISDAIPYLIVVTALLSTGGGATSPVDGPFSPPNLLPAYTGEGYSGRIPCFPKGTHIAVVDGVRAVEDLKTGDLVRTADGRAVPITVYSRTLIATAESAPYQIFRHVFGLNADLFLSPLHAFQIKKGLWQIPMFAAKQDSRICQVGIGQPITYYHVECPNFFTDNLLVDGCVVESYGANQIKGMRTLYTYSPSRKGFTRASKPLIKSKPN